MNDTAKTKVAGIYDVFMLGLCIYVLAALGAMTFFRLDSDVVTILNTVDNCICFVFLADFFIKLAKAESRLAYLKWGWIDFVSSIPTLGPLRWGRFARVVRILRLLRGVRSTKHLAQHMMKHRAESAFMVAALTALLVLVFSSIAILQFERTSESNIVTAEDALWWSFVTITTVGYGDKYPSSTDGRIVAAITMIAGVGLFGTFTGFVASWFLEPGEQEQEDELEILRNRLTDIESHLAKIADKLN